MKGGGLVSGYREELDDKLRAAMGNMNGMKKTSQERQQRSRVNSLAANDGGAQTLA